MQNIFCTHCGAPCADNSKFCQQCGTPISRPTPTCASCGAQLDPTTKFCPNCGTPVGNTGAQPMMSPTAPRPDVHNVYDDIAVGETVIKNGREFTKEESGLLVGKDGHGNDIVDAGSYFHVQQAERATRPANPSGQTTRTDARQGERPDDDILSDFDAPSAPTNVCPAPQAATNIPEPAPTPTAPMDSPSYRMPDVHIPYDVAPPPPVSWGAQNQQPLSQPTYDSDFDNGSSSPLRPAEQDQSTPPKFDPTDADLVESMDSLSYLAALHGNPVQTRVVPNAQPAEEYADDQAKFQGLANRDGYYNDRSPLDEDTYFDDKKRIQWVPTALAIIGVILFAVIAIRFM